MASSASTKKRQNALGNDEGMGRSSSSKPQLLAHLPGSMFTSPGFIMGLIAVEFLYGLFLFAVMSTSKRNRADANNRPELHTEAAPVEPPFVPKTEADHPAAPLPDDPAKKEEKTASAREQDTDKAGKKAQSEKARESTSATPAADTTVVKTEAPKESSAKEKRGKQDEKKELALATPEPTPTTPDQAVKKPPATMPPLGSLIDPLQDSQVKIAEDAFTLQVAAGPHIFDPIRNIADAPRALTEVDGDFTAEVKILGDFQPGTVPLKGLFFTFQGAGLLLWHDKDNYIRFERAAGYDGERFQWLFLESYKDGKPTPKKPMNVRDGAVTLRVERRANLINYTYSLDGKTWLKVANAATTLPRKISIGISATNASPRSFPARFTDFVFKPAS